MISKIVSKDKGQIHRLSFENTVDVYIILHVNNFEVVGVRPSCRNVRKTQEWVSAGKKNFDILTTDFSKIHTDRVVKMKKSLASVELEHTGNAIPVMSNPFFQKSLQENGETLWWSNISIPVAKVRGNTESNGLYIPEIPPISQQGQRNLAHKIEDNGSLALNEAILRKSNNYAYKQLMIDKEKYQTMFELIDDGFCIIKMIFDNQDRPVDFCFKEVNPAFKRITNFEYPEGQKMSSLAPDLGSDWYDMFGKVAKTRESIHREKFSQPFDRYFDVHAFPFGNPTEQMVAVLFKDITENKENEYTNALLGAIVDNSDDAIISKDLNGVVTSWNNSAERLFGYTADEAIGEKITLIIPDERIEEEDEILRQLKNGERIDHFETVRERKDGSRLDISLTISPVQNSDGEIIGASKIARDISIRKEAERKLKKLNQNLEERVKDRTKELQSYQQELRSLASELSKAKEEERHHLATELHNNLGQMLTMAKMKLDETDTTSFPPEASDNMADLSELLNETLTYTRDLMTKLKPPPVLDKEEVREVLEWIVKQMKRYDLEVTLENDGHPKPLSEEKRRILSQCVRELLMNVVKYADVDKAHIKSSLDHNNVKVVIEDKGKGFDQNSICEFSNDGGFGLFNIREQMNWIGGNFSIMSEPGQGTKAILHIPIKEKEQKLMSTDKQKGEELTTSKGDEKAKQKRELTILIADDHQMVRNGFRQMINKQEDMNVVGEAADGEETVKIAREVAPDVILMDVNMPAMDGIEATKIITSELPDICVIGLSLHDSEEVVENMISAGASAYLSKDQAFKALVKTIRREVKQNKRT